MMKELVSTYLLQKLVNYFFLLSKSIVNHIYSPLQAFWFMPTTLSLLEVYNCYTLSWNSNLWSIISRNHFGHKFQVHCQNNGNSSATVIMRRENGDFNFQQSWTNYARGFGHMPPSRGDFWLGLDQINYLTSHGKPENIQGGLGR